MGVQVTFSLQWACEERWWFFTIVNNKSWKNVGIYVVDIVTVLQMVNFVTTATATTVPTTWTMRRSARERSSPVWTEIPWLFIQRLVSSCLKCCYGKFINSLNKRVLYYIILHLYKTVFNHFQSSFNFLKAVKAYCNVVPCSWKVWKCIFL